MLKKGPLKKTYSVHRVITLTFLGPKPDANTQINHKDYNRSNNCLDNLEYVTPKDNNIHKYERPNSATQGVVMVDPKTLHIVKEFNSITNAAKEMGLHNSTIGNVVRKVSHTAGGYFWFKKGEIIKSPIITDIRKSVLKMDLNGNVINEYRSITDAIRSVDGKMTTFRRYVDSDKPYKRFLWRMKQ